METAAEYAEAQVRKFMTVLMTLRARRHLRSLAELYNWTPEFLAEQEARFLQPGTRFIPTWN
jgi:hypothetical protein